MQLFEEINNKLKDVPGIDIEKGDVCFSVIPKTPEGFTVSLHIDEEEFTVSYGDGWHGHFSSEKEAVNCFYFGLSNKCRVKVLQRGNLTYKWIVEYIDEGIWNFESGTGLLFFPFWRKKEITILQNNVL